eukprot:11029428-Lingulodinium_polyedra.AAC.1
MRARAGVGSARVGQAQAYSRKFQVRVREALRRASAVEVASGVPPPPATVGMRFGGKQACERFLVDNCAPT